MAGVCPECTDSSRLNSLSCGSKWWRRQWVEEFFPSVTLGDPKLDGLLRQFGFQVGRC